MNKYRVLTHYFFCVLLALQFYFWTEHIVSISFISIFIEITTIFIVFSLIYNEMSKNKEKKIHKLKETTISVIMIILMFIIGCFYVNKISFTSQYALTFIIITLLVYECIVIYLIIKDYISDKKKTNI